MSLHRYKDGGKSKSAGKRSHLVAESSVRVRNRLRRKDRIFIEWDSCRIKDYEDVLRCFKCQRYGHIAKHCTVKVVCPQCSEEHEFKDCTKKGKESAKWKIGG